MLPRLAVECFGRRCFAHGGCHRPGISAAINSRLFLAARCVRTRRVRFTSRKIARVEKRGFSAISAIRVRDRASGQCDMSQVQSPEHACSREVPGSRKYVASNNCNASRGLE
eukprot:6200172-Pleurochrysis_carterae.AAC.1